MKNPTIATLLNLIPGLGYIYIGGKRKLFGILVLVGGVAGTIATSFDPLYSEVYSQTEIRGIDSVYLLSLVLVVGAFMYDGYVAANQHNTSGSKKKK